MVDVVVDGNPSEIFHSSDCNKDLPMLRIIIPHVREKRTRTSQRSRRRADDFSDESLADRSISEISTSHS